MALEWRFLLKSLGRSVLWVKKAIPFSSRKFDLGPTPQVAMVSERNGHHTVGHTRNPIGNKVRRQHKGTGVRKTSQGSKKILPV